jgi:serine/threonine-protein kinase mTOR
LTLPLANALRSIIQNIPDTRRIISECLLDIISVTLTGEKFKRSASKYVKQLSDDVGATYNTLENATNTHQLSLALNVLRSTCKYIEFDLTNFITGCVVHFLDAEDLNVRVEAALTCATMTFPYEKEVQPLNRSTSLKQNDNVESEVEDIIEKLLIVGIADVSPTMRSCVLSCLDEKFDYYLEQPENLKSLYISISDEVYEVKNFLRVKFYFY